MGNLLQVWWKKKPHLLQNVHVILKREGEFMYLHTARNVKVGGFGLEGLWILIRFQFLPSLHPWVLLWVIGWKKKKILKTIPIKLPKRSFLQDEIIKNHEVLAAFQPEIICFLICSGYLASLKSLQILANLT